MRAIGILWDRGRMFQTVVCALNGSQLVRDVWHTKALLAKYPTLYASFHRKRQTTTIMEWLELFVDREGWTLLSVHTHDGQAYYTLRLPPNG